MIFFLLFGFPVLAIWLVARFGLDGTKNPPAMPPEDAEFTHDEPPFWKNRK